MPKAHWFSGAQVNYARQVFRHVEHADRAGQPATVADVARSPHWLKWRRGLAVAKSAYITGTV